MANLSKIKRERMIKYLDGLKRIHSDDESIIAINEIEKELTDKKYGLVWERHTEEIYEMLGNNIPVLTEDTSRTIKKNDKQWNFLIEGDNLQSLHLLEKTHKGKIDIIYIDPPYNTGSQDWKYNNNYVDDKDYFRHSKWISMMYERLKIAKRLLSPKGALICAIDDNEQPNLILLLKELFGESGETYDINCVTVVHNPRGTQADKFSAVSEYAVFVTPTNVKNIAKKKAKDEDVSWRSLRRTGDESLRTDAKNCFFPIYIKNNEVVGFGDVCPDDFHPSSPCIAMDDGRIAVYPIDPNGVERKWGYARHTIEEIKDQLVPKKVGRSSNSIDYYDIYIGYLYVTQRTVWDDVTYDANAYGTQLLGEILTTTFPFPKSLFLVEDCLKAIIHKKNAVILDFFAGSGTTGHAVLDMNENDGGTRKFILCTNNELSALATLEYVKDNGYMLDYVPTKRTKATAIENKIKKFRSENPDISKKLFETEEGIVNYHEYGICRGVTYQRIRTLLTGLRKDGSKYSDGLNANLKYLKCEWIPRAPSDYLLSNALCLHIKEMLELQNFVEIDNRSYVLVLNKSDFKKYVIDNPKTIKQLWYNQNMIMTSEEMMLLKKCNGIPIPKEFFGEELKEAGE